MKKKVNHTSRNAFILSFIFIQIACVNSLEDREKLEKSSTTVWQYPDSLDAVAIAPKSHEILLENEYARVLRVLIKPGEKEPFHTHKWKSIMHVQQPARIRYYNDKNEIVYESPEVQLNPIPRTPTWMEREEMHAVENIDTIEFIAYRTEIKD